ncbi:MAG TPA: hypothetical protein VFD31_13085 [Thermoleophilaceae bacterium]|nr:hypothetical protein [Thermoleophilaceae bacterium]
MTAKRVLGTAAALALSAAAVCAGSYGPQAAGAGTSGKGGLPQGSEPVTLDPAGFTTRIDHPWWPMRVGTRWIYRETAPDGTKQRVVVTVTGRKKMIANGVMARVVHDVVTEKGKPVEVTDDWYAQDKAGNIWYLGEATKEYENGKFRSTEGSFEAGVDGAQAGVILPAKPRPGMRYRQEYYKGQAEDKGEIVSLREQAEVPFGHFGRGRVLMTKDTNPLEPKVLEFKFYARGIGPVLAVGVSGGADREELVRFKRGR